MTSCSANINGWAVHCFCYLFALLIILFHFHPDFEIPWLRKGSWNEMKKETEVSAAFKFSNIKDKAKARGWKSQLPRLTLPLVLLTIGIRDQTISLPGKKRYGQLLRQPSSLLLQEGNLSPRSHRPGRDFQARILEWVAISYSRGSHLPRDGTWVSLSPALTGRFFTSEPPGKPKRNTALV